MIMLNIRPNTHHIGIILKQNCEICRLIRIGVG